MRSKMRYPTDPAQGVKRCLAVIAIATALIGGFVVYRAVSFEVKGEARYREGGRGSANRVVTRQESPTEFRAVVKGLWLKSGLCFLAAVASFAAYRKVDDFV